MEFKIASSMLQKALQKAVLLIDDSHKETVLGHILMQGRGNDLLLTVSGFDAELQFQLDCKTDGQFERTFPARKTSDICRTLPSDHELSINLDDDKVSKLNCGHSNFTLSTIDASEFPSLHRQEMETTAKISIESDSFHDIVAKTSFSMAVADVRPMLNGLLFDFNKGVLNVVATDGHRLACCRKEVDFSGERLQIIMPRKVVERLDRILSREGDDIVIHASDRYVRMEQGGVSIICRLIEGQYPDYEKVIPKPGANSTLHVERSELAASLARVRSLVSSESTSAAKMKVSDGRMHLNSRSVVGEEANDEIDIRYTGDTKEVNFNISYLKEALEKMSGDSVRIELRDSVSSFLVLPDDNQDQKYVIMPMRV